MPALEIRKARHGYPLVDSARPLFNTGLVVSTPAAERDLKASFGPDPGAVRRATVTLILRHASGDFGDIAPALEKANGHAIRYGGIIRSTYTLPAKGNRRAVTLFIKTDNRSQLTSLTTAEEN